MKGTQVVTTCFIAAAIFVQVAVRSTWAGRGFIKDQSLTRIEFPPPVTRSFDSRTPTGHLRPLGWQRGPVSRVPEVHILPKPDNFFTNHVNASIPIVLRKAARGDPALTLWQEDDYLKKTYGDIDIHVTVKKELLQKGPQKMKFKKFLREYHYEDWYLSNIIPREMMGELTLPRCLGCGIRNRLQEAEVWISSGGTSSLLHAHADHNLHCLLAGRKDFILIDAKYKDKLKVIEKRPHQGAGYSDMDADMVNMYQYPGVKDTPWSWATLWEGDCIYIPAKTLHQVRSFGRSLSSTVLWAPDPNATCPETDREITAPRLDQVEFIWSYYKGDRELSNRDLNAESFRRHLLVWMRDEPVLRFEVFEDYFLEIVSELKKMQVSHPTAEKVWTALTGNTLKEVSRQEVVNLSEQSLSQVAHILNEVHKHHEHYASLHDEL